MPCECLSADGHLTQPLRFVVISAYTLSYIAYMSEIILFSLCESSAGIYPDNIAVIMSAKVKGLSEIVRACGIGRYNNECEFKAAHKLLHISG